MSYNGMSYNDLENLLEEYISTLYQDIVDGKYVTYDRRYEIPLTRVQRYKLRKKQIPEIFLSDP